jgi:outer membrane protein insertion porin family
MFQLMRIWMILILALLAAVTVRAAQADDSLTIPGGSVELEELSFRVKDSYQDKFDLSAFARALVNLKPGDRLTEEKLEQARSALGTIGRVETVLEQGRLAFTLVPFKRIKSIRIRGHYPLFEKEVRDVMTIRPGMIFNPQELPEQIALITERFKSEGYIDPEVTVDWRHDSGDGHYQLSVIINKGAFFTVGRFKIKGNRAFADSLLKATLSSWRTSALWAGQGRFAQQIFKQDVKKLLAFYRKQGYADAQLTYTLTPLIDKRQMDIELVIEEGALYEISFGGNTHFLDYTLNKDLELFTVGNRGNIGLRRTVQNIRRRYLGAGFADVGVKWDQSDSESQGRTLRSVQLVIDEGLQHKIRAVTVQGERFFDEKKIKKQMLTRSTNGLGNGIYDAHVLDEDLVSLRALYKKYGFIDARISKQVDIDPSDKSVSVAVGIAEGRQTRVGRISFTGQLPESVDELAETLQLESGQPFQPDLVAVDENNLSAHIAPHGYPHVRVEASVTRSADQPQADITFRIVPGPFVRVGNVFFAGNFRTQDPILKRELEFRSGDPFSLAAVLEAQRNLRKLNLFESVRVRTIGLKEQSSAVHLLFMTVEKRPYFYEIGGGYETSKGFYARTKIGDHNFWGTDKDIWLGGEVAETGYRWDAGISNPRLLGTRMQADIGGYIEREEQFNQDFGTDTAGATLNVSRRWPRSLISSLGWRYERREQFLRERDASQPVDEEALEPRSNLVTTPAVGYDSRDSFIRPTRGLFSNLSVDISKGLNNDLDDFTRYKADLRIYHALRPQLTLAAIARMGYIVAFGENASIPEDQLFFLGGTLDVRGYKENLLQFDADDDPAGGRLAWSTSVEARYDIGKNVELAPFVDAGRLQLTTEDAADEDWRWAVGLGIRYLTPIGPIGLLYGHKIDPRPGESRGQFHFTIGYTF